MQLKATQWHAWSCKKLTNRANLILFPNLRSSHSLIMCSTMPWKTKLPTNEGRSGQWQNYFLWHVYVETFKRITNIEFRTTPIHSSWRDLDLEVLSSTLVKHGAGSQRVDKEAACDKGEICQRLRLPFRAVSLAGLLSRSKGWVERNTLATISTYITSGANRNSIQL